MVQFYAASEALFIFAIAGAHGHCQQINVLHSAVVTNCCQLNMGNRDQQLQSPEQVNDWAELCQLALWA